MPVIAASSLLRDILTPAPAPAPAPAAVADASPSASPSAEAPPEAVHLMSLEEALRRRRSVRTFTAEPVSGPELDLIIGSGLAAERTGWPSGSHPAMGVTIAVAAYAVGGLEPGLYLPEPGTGRLSALPLDEGSLTGWPAQYAVAPVLLFVCGSLTQACAAFGQRGYPRLLVRAGAAGYGAWLAAVGAGLSGCAYGGSNHRVAAAVRRPSAARRGCGSLRHLFTVAVGRTAREVTNDG
jgi:hypothetical protein